MLLCSNSSHHLPNTCSLGIGRSQENHLENPKRGIGSSQLLPEQDKRRPRLRFCMQAWNSVAHSDRPDREGRRDARISKPRKESLLLACATGQNPDLHKTGRLPLTVRVSVAISVCSLGTGRSQKNHLENSKRGIGKKANSCPSKTGGGLGYGFSCKHGNRSPIFGDRKEPRESSREL